MMLSSSFQSTDYIANGSALWFIILAILSIMLLLYTFWRKKDLKLLALFLFLSSIAFAFEYIVFILLQSYSY